MMAQDPPVDQPRIVFGHREQPQRGGARREEDPGGKREQHQVIRDDHVNQGELVAGVALLEQEHKQGERDGGEHRQPHGLQDQMRHHPAHELESPQPDRGHHPGADVTGGAEVELPRQEPAGQDRTQPQQRQPESPGPAPAVQFFPDAVERVIGVGFRTGNRPAELLPQGRYGVDQPFETQPQADIQTALDLSISPFALPELLLQGPRECLARLLVRQPAHIGVDLLRRLWEGRFGGG